MRELSTYAFHTLPATLSSIAAVRQLDYLFDGSSSMEGALKWETLVRWMEAVYPLFQNAVGILVCYWIAVLIPMSIFRRLHGFIAGTLNASSILIGFVCWWHCVVVADRLLGSLVTAVGLLCGGIGVVPAALFASARERDWDFVSNILVLTLLMVIARTVAKLITARAPRTRLVLRGTHYYSDEYY